MPEELTEQSKTLKEESLPTADDSVIEPTDPSDVFRRGVSDVMFERDTVIDVLSGLPDGHSIDQTLGVGLDGAPIDTARNHFGIGDDDLLAGRSINSPLGMTGDSLIDTSADTNNEAPPDIATGSSNPIHNMGLVSGEDGGTDDKGLVDTVVDTVNDWFSGKTTEPADAGTVRPEGDTPVPKPKPKGPVRPGSEDDYMTNPDADTGGTATDADIERAIVKQGADTDFVEGFAGGPVITGDSPPTRPIDLVRDPVDDDQGSGVVTVVGSDPGTLPQDEISHTVNPNDGLPTPTAPPPGSGGPSGTGGDDIGMGSLSSAATGAGADAGVINIGRSTPPTDLAGFASEGIAMTGGDDDDLDELDVQRHTINAGGSGTQTEDEIYIGSASEPVQAFGAPGRDALTVAIDASIEVQDSFDSVFDSELDSEFVNPFAPPPDDAGEAHHDEPSFDDGF